MFVASGEVAVQVEGVGGIHPTVDNAVQLDLRGGDGERDGLDRGVRGGCIE